VVEMRAALWMWVPDDASGMRAALRSAHGRWQGWQRLRRRRGVVAGPDPQSSAEASIDCINSPFAPLAPLQPPGRWRFSLGKKSNAPGVEARSPGVSGCFPGVATAAPGIWASTPGQTGTSPGKSSTPCREKIMFAGKNQRPPGVFCISPRVAASTCGRSCVFPGAKSGVPRPARTTLAALEVTPPPRFPSLHHALGLPQSVPKR
jgi:hypothetical protein